jgi:hypothetical protein
VALNDDRVSQIVQSFALAALDPAQWLPAMASLSDSIGGVCCALELTDLNTGVAVMKNTLELDETLLRDYEERIFHINPRVKNGMLLQIGDIADDRTLMDASDPNASEFIDWLEKTPYYFMKGGKVLD